MEESRFLGVCKRLRSWVGPQHTQNPKIVLQKSKPECVSS
jgi:hypothetical protein